MEKHHAGPTRQVIVADEPPENVFGVNPTGYLVLTREGRSIVVTTEGDELFIELARGPSIVFPGKTGCRRIVWEREK